MADLHDLHDQIVDRRDRLGQTLSKLAGENQRLAAMVEQKSRLQKSTLAESAAAQDRLKVLADQAESLKDLLDRLERAKQEEAEKAEKARQDAAKAEAARQEAARKAARRPGNRTDSIAMPPSTSSADDMAETEQSAGAPGLSAAGKEANIKSARSARPFPASGKDVVLPVRGRLAARFGAAATEFGESKGIVLSTRANAQVVAPFDGKVVFEGPFRSYGQILIIEHRGGYHTVLAGLGRVDAVVGQWLLAGEPVGVMGSSGMAATDQGASGDSPGTSAQDHPKLYVELRHKGQPVDPAPWFGTLTRVDNSEGQ
jgi:septal ring factor EnvC (AmiA/AmiB activator)